MYIFMNGNHVNKISFKKTIELLKANAPFLYKLCYNLLKLDTMV